MAWRRALTGIACLILLSLVVFFLLLFSGCADTTKPTVSIIQPDENSLVRGAKSIEVTASDDVSLKKVEFYIDGALKSTSTSESTTHTWLWDTSKAKDGSHAIKVIAYDEARNKETAYCHVEVDNTPPALTISDPPDNTVVDKDQLSITGKTEPNVTLKLNDKQQSTQADGSFSCPCTLTQGKNTLLLTSTDTAGNTTRKEITVTYNPPPPPTAQQPPPSIQPPPAPQPEPQPEYPYTASKLRDPFHYTRCYWAQQIHPENRQWFSTREEAIAAGHRPCKVCNP